MSKDLKEVFGKSTVMQPTGAIEETNEKLGLTISDGPIGEVGCVASFTMNLGNYQSSRMEVSLKVPSNIDPYSLDKTFNFAKDWVDDKLAGMIKDAKEAMGQK